MAIELPKPDGFIGDQAFYFKETVLKILSAQSTDTPTPHQERLRREAQVQRGEVPSEELRTPAVRLQDGVWISGD